MILFFIIVCFIKKSLSIIVIKKYVIFHIYRNPDILSYSSAIAESEAIREEDEFNMEKSGLSASSGASKVEEAAYAMAGCCKSRNSWLA